MRSLFVLAVIVLLASCAKEENVQTFDAGITLATDFRTDATGDTTYAIFMPSGFTPNGDGTNDIYLVYGQGIRQDDFTLRIFNRYGNLVYYSDDVLRGWGGEVQGKSNINPPGLYEVDVQLTDTSGEAHHYSYRIQLLR